MALTWDYVNGIGLWLRNLALGYGYGLELWLSVMGRCYGYVYV